MRLHLAMLIQSCLTIKCWKKGKKENKIIANKFLPSNHFTVQWRNLTELGVFNQWASLWIFSRKSKMWWKPLKKRTRSQDWSKDFKICCNICHLFSSTSCWEKPLEIITLKFDYCWLSSHLFRFSWIYTVFYEVR